MTRVDEEGVEEEAQEVQGISYTNGSGSPFHALVQLNYEDVAPKDMKGCTCYLSEHWNMTLPESTEISESTIELGLDNEPGYLVDNILACVEGRGGILAQTY